MENEEPKCSQGKTCDSNKSEKRGVGLNGHYNARILKYRGLIILTSNLTDIKLCLRSLLVFD